VGDEEGGFAMMVWRGGRREVVELRRFCEVWLVDGRLEWSGWAGVTM